MTREAACLVAMSSADDNASCLTGKASQGNQLLNKQLLFSCSMVSLWSVFQLDTLRS